MTKDLANIFKQPLISLKNDGLISNLEGLVKTLEYKPANSEKTLKIAYPADCQEPENCQECEGLFICVPEKKKKLLVYFEGNNSRELSTFDGATKYQTVLSLVCWYNLDYFETQDFLQSKLISLFSERIKKTSSTNSEENPIFFENPEILNVIDSDPVIFSKYSYNESSSNFLGCKYSTFKIDFKIDFTLYENSNCLNDILVISNDNCC